MQKKKTYLGIDLGGTKLLIGEVDEEGKVLRSKRYPSLIASGASQTEVMKDVVKCIEDYLKKYMLVPGEDFEAIGMGMVGRVDPEEGLWLEIQKPRMETVRSAEILSERFHVSSGIDNDVRSGAEAERRFGKAKGCDDYIYMNIGTGIGAAFVNHGQMLTGAHYCGGEVGHNVVNINSDVQCPCGRMGCAEALASGMGLHNRAVSLRQEYPYTALVFPEEGRIDGRKVFELAEKGDALCIRLADDAVKAVAGLLENFLWLADPEKIIMGGGLITDGRILERVQKLMSPMSTRFLKDGIEMTGLDSDFVGLVGAAAVGIRTLENRRGKE